MGLAFGYSFEGTNQIVINFKEMNYFSVAIKKDIYWSFALPVKGNLNSIIGKKKLIKFSIQSTMVFYFSQTNFYDHLVFKIERANFQNLNTTKHKLTRRYFN